MELENIEVRCPFCDKKFSPLTVEDTDEKIRNVLIACKNFEAAAENLYDALSE
jgi:hypothetical protein